MLTLEELPRVKSVGNGTTTYRDLVTDDEIKAVLYTLCESVSSRLREQGLVCKTVQLGIRESDLHRYERQGQLICPTRTAEALFEKSFELLKRNLPKGRPIRSLSVRATGLSGDGREQLSMFPEETALGRREELEQCIDSLRTKFGLGAVRRGIMFRDPALCGPDFGIDREEMWEVG